MTRMRSLGKARTCTQGGRSWREVIAPLCRVPCIHTHQFEDSQQAHKAQGGDRRASKGQESDDDNDKIKDVPSVSEEQVGLIAFSNQLDDNFQDEDC